MIPSARRRFTIALATIASLAATLIFFPPDRYSFYPRCPIHALFGIQCPGCGATRALAALLRGHLTEALHLNPLTTLLLPVTLLYLALTLWQQRATRSIAWPQPPAYAIYGLLTLAALFTIARNLPVS